MGSINSLIAANRFSVKAFTVIGKRDLKTRFINELNENH